MAICNHGYANIRDASGRGGEGEGGGLLIDIQLICMSLSCA